jgi:predicted regulator of Ras-like GTPase activity (Roadblock/LC7/MglB family)
VVASLLPSDVDEELIAGMAASLLGVGERISSDLMGASMEQIYTRSPKGYIVLQAINGDAALVLLVTREAKLGLVFLEVKRVAAELARIV